MEEELFNLETFEKYIINKNEKKKYLYILSKEFSNHNNGTCLGHLSIFDNEQRGTIKQDKKTVQKILNILMSEISSQEKRKKLEDLKIKDEEKRGIGSMLGMVIGDAMGARNEFKPIRYNIIDLKDMGKLPGGNFNLSPGQWTDDTSMGLCLADSLLMKNGELDEQDLMRRFIAWVKSGYNNAFRFNHKYGLPIRRSVGLGGNISLSIFRYIDYYRKFNCELEGGTDAGDQQTSGNGSIMRNAAIPICFHEDIILACDNARKQSKVTHQGLEAKECCSLLTHIIVKIFKGNQELKTILENLEKEFKTDVKSVEFLAKSKMEGNDINRDWNWKIKKQYHYSPERSNYNKGYIGSYAMDSMAMSLNILYNTDSFENAIIRSVNLRGDSDSVSSVVGQIAGAYYPIENIPGDWIKEIFKWDQGEISLRGYMLSRLKKGESYIIKN